jgi:hypothetical protein
LLAIARPAAPARRGQQRPTAAQTYDNLTAAKQIAQAAKDMGWSPQTTEAVTRDVVDGGGGTIPSMASQMLLGASPVSDSSANPTKLLSGEAATLQAAQMLANAQPINLPDGQVLQPGTIWNDSSMFISAGWASAYYLKNGDLYEWNTSQFMRNELLSGWQQGVSSASTWIYLSDVEISLLAGTLCWPRSVSHCDACR